MPTINMLVLIYNRLEARNGSSNVIASTCTNPNGCSIKLDSGMPYIAGPSGDIAGLQSFIGAKWDGSDVRKE